MRITVKEQTSLQRTQKWKGEITYLLKDKASSRVSIWKVLLRKVSEKQELRRGGQVTKVERKTLVVLTHKKRRESNLFNYTMSEVCVLSKSLPLAYYVCGILLNTLALHP